MNTKKKILVSALALSLLGGVAPVQAVRPAADETQVEARTQAARQSGETDKLDALRDRAMQEVERRAAALEKTAARLKTMKRVSEEQKNALQSAIQSQLDALASLKDKILADADLSALRTDAQSIDNSYHLFALALPQSATIAAADRALSLADTMTVLGDKLETRIQEAETIGKNVAPLKTALTEYRSKVADAKTRAQSAIDQVENLTPDQGDKTKMAANLLALKEARTQIQQAQQDFVAARKAAKAIVQELRAPAVDETTANETID